MKVYVLTAVYGNNTEVVGVFSTSEKLREFTERRTAEQETGCNYAEYQPAIPMEIDREAK